MTEPASAPTGSVELPPAIAATYREARTLIGHQTPWAEGRYAVEHDPIRRHCHMVDWDDPLYLDPDHAARSRFGAVLCPPSQVLYFALPGHWPPSEVPALPELPAPGSGRLNLALETEWLQPVRVGDRLRCRQSYEDVYVKAIAADPLAFWFVIARTIVNQAGETVCVERNLALRHRTAEELAAAGPEQAGPPPVRSERRPAAQPTAPNGGPPPRPQAGRWEDVAEGAPLPAFDLPIDERRLMLSVSGSQDLYELHYDRAFARAHGQPEVIVSNIFLRAALCRLITGWLGEAGWLERMRLEMRAPVRPGDVMRVQGQVVRRYRDGERGCLDLAALIVVGERRAAVATATASLP